MKLRQTHLNNTKLIIFCIIGFSLAWYINNHSTFDIYPDNPYEKLLHFNGAVYGYCSIMNYSIIFPLPVLLCLDVWLNKETIVWTTRMANRMAICRYRLKRDAVFVLIIVSIHCGVNMVGMNLFFQ